MAKEKDCCCCTQKCGVITAGVVGLVLVILGGLFVFLFDLIFVAIVENVSMAGKIRYTLTLMLLYS